MMTPYGLLLELAAAALIAALFNRYCAYRTNARTAAGWHLFWRAMCVTVALCTLGVVLSLITPARPLLMVGWGLDISAGLVGLLVMAVASVRALRHGVQRRLTRLGCSSWRSSSPCLPWGRTRWRFIASRVSGDHGASPNARCGDDPRRTRPVPRADRR
ncbi:MAG: hypothetical protein M3Y74_14710 [Chloroflexota bacterium]|nr:hypothetical protein [Chloroflexota bacterium]